MNIKEFFGKAAAGIYVSGLSVIVLVVALIGYIMYGLEKNNLEALIVVFTLMPGLLMLFSKWIDPDRHRGRTHGNDPDTGERLSSDVG